MCRDMVIIIAYWPILALYLLLFSELGFGGTVFKVFVFIATC